MYLVYARGEIAMAKTLEVILGVFEGIHGRPMRASPVPGEYAYQVFPDFPGMGWSRAERAIANLRWQKPEEMPPLPVSPFATSDAWGNDD